MASNAARGSATSCLKKGVRADSESLEPLAVLMNAEDEDAVTATKPLNATDVTATCSVAAVAISSACWSSGVRESDGPRLTPARTSVEVNETACKIALEGASTEVTTLGAAEGRGVGRVVEIGVGSRVGATEGVAERK